MLPMRNTNNQNAKDVILNITYKSIVADAKSPVFPQFALKTFC